MNKQTKNSTTLKSGSAGLAGLSLNIAIIAAIFSILIAVVMLVNYYRLSANDPIESETLKTLVERLKSEPNNQQLMNEIRAFDLLARKAYFSAKWQIQTGALLLVIGAIVLVLSLRYYFGKTSKIEKPEADTIDQQTGRMLSSKWLLGAGALVIVAAIVASFLSVDQLDKFSLETATPVEATSQVEVVDLTPAAPASEIIVEDVATETPVSEAAPAQPQTQTQTQSSSTYPSLDAIKKQHNSFRGALGQGISIASNVPVKWNVQTGENLLWKVKIPLKGYSSPVIWGDKLFVTGANNQERWVYCYNKNNGQIIWQQQANNIPGSPATPPKTTDDTGLAAPSVVTNGMFVTAIFGTGDIITFDMEGKRIWAKNMGVPDNHYGHSSSLLAWKEKIFVQYDTNKGGRMLALNVQTGGIIWDIKRTSKISWASPILIDVDGKMQIVTSADPSVAGYDIENGKELWKVDCMMGEVGPSPGYGNGLVYATNEYATLAAIDPSKGTIVWQDNYYLPEVASPVVADGLIFIATTYGVFACFDAHSGKMYWEAEFNEGFYASPIIADGKIYAIDMKGVVHIIKIDRELNTIASLPLGEKITTTPAFTDGRMYVRGAENLYCIGEK